MDLDINRPLRVYHCDDDPFELERVTKALESSNLGVKFDLSSFRTPGEFLKQLESKAQAPDVIMLDIDLGPNHSKGTDLAVIARKTFPTSVIIMCSALDDGTTIRQSLKSGADDFVSKKSDHAELGLRVINSFKLSLLKRGHVSSLDRSIAGLAGKTIQTIAKRVPRILSSAITSVHISGESGTGKEVVADIFATSVSPNTPFVKVNCGAITPTLLESELFGHTKGAFTGAVSDKRGLIEAANGGWIFLDEVATLSASAQAALLRAIENQEIIRVGDNQVRSIKVKFISATNESLEELVQKGRFRKDLWQRLCETEIKLPPLRDRPDEIEPLIRYFCKEMAGGPYDIDAAAMEALCAAPWLQGNVRELRNCLRAMTELHVNRLLTPLAIPAKVWDSLDDHLDEERLSSDNVPALSTNLLTVRWNQETTPGYDLLADLLLIELIKLRSGGKKISIRTLSKSIGLSRSTLSGRLKSIAQNDHIQFDELAKLVSIGEV